MESVNWMELAVGAVLVAAPVIVGFMNNNSKLKSIMHAVDQSDDVTAAVVNAMKDGTLTREEVELIAKEIREAKQAWGEVV